MCKFTATYLFLFVILVISTLGIEVLATNVVNQRVRNVLAEIFPAPVPANYPVEGVRNLIRNRYGFFPNPSDLGPTLNSLMSGRTMTSDPHDGFTFRNIVDREAGVGDNIQLIPPREGHAKPPEFMTFRVGVPNGSGAGKERLIIDLANKEIYFTADHYVHVIPYSKELGGWFPILELEGYSKSKKWQLSSTSLETLKNEIFGKLDGSIKKFRAEIASKFDSAQFEAFKSHPQFKEIQYSYLRSWKSNLIRLESDAAVFNNLRQELQLGENALTANSHDLLIIHGPSNGEHILFLEKNNGRAHFIGYRSPSGSLKRILLTPHPGQPGRFQVEEQAINSPTQAAVAGCTRRLNRRQASCVREKAKFSPKINDRNSVKFEMTTTEAEAAVAHLEQNAAGKSFILTTRGWGLAHVVVETGAKVIEAGATLAIVAFDTYHIVDKCALSESKGVRDCMIQVVTMALDLISIAGCGLVGGPGAAIVCGMAAAILTAPFAASMVELGAGLHQTFHDMFLYWSRGQITEGFRKIASDAQRTRDQILSQFEPLGNFILSAIRTASTYFGRAVHAVTAFLGCQDCEGEFSRFELTIEPGLAKSLRSQGHRYMALMQSCTHGHFLTFKKSQFVEFDESGHFSETLKTERCPWPQNVGAMEIDVYKATSETEPGLDCVKAVDLKSHAKVPDTYRHTSWRPAVNMEYRIAKCALSGPVKAPKENPPCPGIGGCRNTRPPPPQKCPGIGGCREVRPPPPQKCPGIGGCRSGKRMLYMQ